MTLEGVSQYTNHLQQEAVGCCAYELQRESLGLIPYSEQCLPWDVPRERCVQAAAPVQYDHALSSILPAGTAQGQPNPSLQAEKVWNALPIY